MCVPYTLLLLVEGGNTSYCIVTVQQSVVCFQFAQNISSSCAVFLISWNYTVYSSNLNRTARAENSLSFAKHTYYQGFSPRAFSSAVSDRF